MTIGSLPQPVTHLRERMPDILVVELGERVHFDIVDL